MEITPEQKVTSDNFKAHLQSLKNELKIVSDELAEKMDLRDKTSAEVDVLCRKKKTTEEEIEVFNKLKQDIINREKSVVEKESKLEQSIQDFNNDKEIKIVEINNYKDQVERESAKVITQYTGIIEKISFEKVRLQELYDSMRDVLDKLKQAEDSKLKATNELDIIKIAINEKTLEYEKLIKDKEVELLKWKVKLEQAQKDVEKPFANLEEEKLSFYKALNNLEVRKRRLAKYTKKYFPNEVLKI